MDCLLSPNLILACSKLWPFSCGFMSPVCFLFFPTMANLKPHSLGCLYSVAHKRTLSAFSITVAVCRGGGFHFYIYIRSSSSSWLLLLLLLLTLVVAGAVSDVKPNQISVSRLVGLWVIGLQKLRGSVQDDRGTLQAELIVTTSYSLAKPSQRAPCGQAEATAKCYLCNGRVPVSGAQVQLYPSDGSTGGFVPTRGSCNVVVKKCPQ